jgi:membrane-associated phospholipid phosphatase
MTQTASADAPGHWIARLISTIFHPVVLPLLTLGVLTYYAPGGSIAEASWWAAVAFVLTALPVSLLVFVQVRRGEWTDTDVSVRRQRYLLYPYGVACMLAAFIAFLALGAPGIAARAALGAAAANAVNGLINLKYKVSAHAATAALCAALLWLATPVEVRYIWGGGAAGAALLVGWSRVALERHTIGQVILGWLVGATSGVAAVVVPWTLALPIKLPR